VNVAVIGGGLAGLAAACELADLGHRPTVFEKRPWCGGKTYSFHDQESGEEVDNGQHVFMTCTTEYIDFLRKIGSLKLTRRQKRLRVTVYNANGRRSVLAAQSLPAPLHLGASFLVYRHLGLLDRVRVGKLMLALRGLSEDERVSLHDVSFAGWLRSKGQSEKAIRDFWDFMLVPTLNCRSDEASASDALFVLRAGFLASSDSAAIGVPGVGLSRLHVEPAVAYIEKRGGEVRTSTEILRLEPTEGGVAGIVSHNRREGQGERHERFDGYVLALPHSKVTGVLPAALAAEEPFRSLAAIKTAPIINLHLWFDRPVADWALAAFVGNELQWVFNRDRLDREPAAGRHRIVISLSAAQPYMGLDREALKERFLPQVRAAIPGAREAELLAFSAIKEPEATFVPAPGMRRPGPRTPLANLVLAGTYTDTGWPATMESAVRSGRTAAHTLQVHMQSSIAAVVVARGGRS
jgi:squalene-associated FAD-dependent desaturase